MTPFYQGEHVTIYCGDTRQILQDVPLEIAGLITDAPYINYRYACEAGFQEPFVDAWEGEWWASTIGWWAHWLPTCVSQMTEGAPAFLFLDTRYLPVLLRMVHICRWSAVDYFQLSADELLVQCGGVQSDPDAHDRLLKLLCMWNRYGQGKAPEILDALVARIPRRSGVILDPFMGQGSTLIAGLKAGWDVVGIEQDEATCAKAVAAIQAAQVPA